MRNVVTWLQAIEKGYEPRLYSYQIEDVPVGEYDAVLDCKVWANKIMGICCYFTQKCTGKKFQLTVYRRLVDKIYKLKSSDIDFTECPLNCAYHIRVSIHEKGRAVFEEVSLV